MEIQPVDTWFFEKLELHFPNILSIKLVEGKKSQNKEFVEVTEEKKLGPYFPVLVHKDSKCIRIIFNEVHSFQVVDESLSSPLKDLDVIETFGPVRQCNALDYQSYIETDTIIKETREGEYLAFYVWSEDQTIFVLSGEKPIVSDSDESPNLELERDKTYFTK